jgi:uncharacterized protein (DUF697 family)
MLDDTTQEQEAPISNEAAQVGLGITDLRVFKEVIDVASARGAFKADEFATIGDAYGRLSTFLTTIDTASTETTDEEVTDEDSTDEEVTDEDSTDEEVTDEEVTDEE